MWNRNGNGIGTGNPRGPMMPQEQPHELPLIGDFDAIDFKVSPTWSLPCFRNKTLENPILEIRPLVVYRPGKGISSLRMSRTRTLDTISCSLNRLAPAST